MDGDYARGYQKGLRKHYYGEIFGEPGEHEKWIAMSGYRHELGNGYRDGFAGEPPKGMHGMTGQQNAIKADEPASSVLTVRVTPHDKARWVKTAQHNGLKLSEWVIKTLNGAL